MLVLLKKEATFNFDESKYTKMPSDVFNNMVEASFPTKNNKNEAIEAEMMYFKNMRDYDDYNFNHNKNGDVFDKTKDVFISQKGEIFVICKAKETTPDEITTNANAITVKKPTNITLTADAAANTEKDKAAKP